MQFVIWPVDDLHHWFEKQHCNIFSHSFLADCNVVQCEQQLFPIACVTCGWNYVIYLQQPEHLMLTIMYCSPVYLMFVKSDPMISEAWIMLISMLVNNDLQTWHLIGWQHSCQPIRGHVRRSARLTWWCNCMRILSALLTFCVVVDFPVNMLSWARTNLVLVWCHQHQDSIKIDVAHCGIFKRLLLRASNVKRRYCLWCYLGHTGVRTKWLPFCRQHMKACLESDSTALHHRTW